MNDQEVVELHFVYTRESYLAARQAYAKRIRPVGQKVRLWVLNTIFVIFGVLPAAYFALLYLAGVPIRFSSFWIAFFYVIILAMAIWDVVEWLRSRLRPRAESFDQDPRWKGERNWIVNDSGLQFESPLSNSHSKWAGFNKVLDTPSCYLFTYGVKDDPGWFYLPKYAFVSKAQEALFRAIIERNIEFQAMR